VNTLSFNKTLGFVLAVSVFFVHYRAGILTNAVLAITISILFVVMINQIYSGMPLVVQALKNSHIPILYFLIFLYSPFLGNLVSNGTFYDTYISLLEVPFRILLLLLFLMVAKLNNSYLLWDVFLKFFVFIYLYFVLSHVVTFLPVNVTNTSGVFVFFGAVHLYLNSRSNLFKVVLFVFTVYFLYYVLVSRTLAIGYIVFHSYLLISNRIPLVLKNKLLILLSLSFVFGIYLFIYLDHSSNITGLMNPITSGRGAIWEHYIDYVLDRSPHFGLGHGRSEHVMSIGNYYNGQMILLRDVMLSGGVHNSFIYMFATRGFFGVIFMLLFINYLFKKPEILNNDFNVAMFLVAAIMMFATGQSTLGGLTVESLLMLISLTVPYRRYENRNIFLYDNSRKNNT